MKQLVLEDRQSWLAKRRQGIGGSDIAAIMGISPYKTSLGVFLEKTSEVVEDPSVMQSQKTQMGHVLEPIIIDLFKKELDDESLEVERYDNVIFINEEHPLFLGSFDGLLKKDGVPIAVVECKNVGGHGTKLWEDGVPPYYYAQVQHYLLVANLELAYVAALFDGWDFKVFQIPRNNNFIDQMIKTVSFFWEEHVDKFNPPSPKTAEDVKALYAEASPGKIKHCNSARALDIFQLKEIQGEMRILKSAEENLKVKIQSYMEDAEILVLQDEEEKESTLATWKKSKPVKRFDVESFKNDNPELYKQYVKEDQGIRRFVVK